MAVGVGGDRDSCTLWLSPHLPWPPLLPSADNVSTQAGKHHAPLSGNVSRLAGRRLRGRYSSEPRCLRLRRSSHYSQHDVADAGAGGAGAVGSSTLATF